MRFFCLLPDAGDAVALLEATGWGLVGSEEAADPAAEPALAAAASNCAFRSANAIVSSRWSPI